MRVCVLYDEPIEVFDPGPFLENYEWELVTLQQPVLETIRSVAEQNEFDVYFNLCDGGYGENYPGIEVAKALEELDLPFTGGDSKFYDPTREQMQAVAEANGIGFARGFRVIKLENVEAAAKKLRYPLMVKHPHGYGSNGMTRASRVDNTKALRAQVERICAEFGGARVEEFIEGPEFTVLVTDDPDDLENPFVYPPAQLIFPDGEDFLHSDAKWIQDVYFRSVTEYDPALANRLQKMSRKMYLAMNGRSYSRCDIRMRPDGELYMLEINPNCGILYSPEELGPADVVMDYDPDGHDGFLERIFRSAILQQREGLARVV